MTAVVVFNPTNIPVDVAGYVIGSGEWAFVEDVASVASLLSGNKLVVSKAPADPVQVNPKALRAFEQLNEFNSKNAVVEQTKRKTRNNKSQTTTDLIEGE